MVDDGDDFHFPSITELNDELFPFPWEKGEQLRIQEEFKDEDTLPFFYTGPPPSPSTYKPPAIPPLSTLVQNIIKSEHKLFFVAQEIGMQGKSEWRLGRVNFKLSCEKRPSCLQDGTFLVEFYMLHCDDVRFNGVNQRYWLQYLTESATVVQTFGIETDVHFIKPTPLSEMQAAQRGLVPFRQWINLTHESKYIHGPFEWAKVRGRQTRDRVSLEDWTVLGEHTRMFSNKLPKLDIPTFSVHADTLAHFTIQTTL